MAEDGTSAVGDRDPRVVEEEHAGDDHRDVCRRVRPACSASDDDEQEVVDRRLEHGIDQRPEFAEDRARLLTADLGARQLGDERSPRHDVAEVVAELGKGQRVRLEDLDDVAVLALRFCRASADVHSEEVTEDSAAEELAGRSTPARVACSCALIMRATGSVMMNSNRCAIRPLRRSTEASCVATSGSNRFAWASTLISRTISLISRWLSSSASVASS